MILEILGTKCIKVEGNVQVDYKTGKTVTYKIGETKHLILNPEAIAVVTINKGK